MTPRRWLFLFLALLTALRLVFIAQAELTPDEAYYQMWSERMDICFYSKGPGVAATIWLGTHLFGVNEFGVRVFSPLLALGTSLLMFSFARRLYGESVGIWTALAINAVPIFNAGSLLMTIDPLSIFFWTAALYTCWLALERSPEFSRWWPITGGLIGLGFLCKYTNAMELLSILLLLAFTRKFRRELARRGFYTMLAAFVPFTLPPIIWNARHDWITLSHLSARGGLQKAFHLDPKEFFSFFGVHYGAYSLLLFSAMIFAVIWAFPQAKHHFKPRFLLAFTLPLWVLYLWLSLKQAGEANWTAPAMVSLVILTVAGWREVVKRAVLMSAILLIGGAGVALFKLPIQMGATVSVIACGCAYLLASIRDREGLSAFVALSVGIVLSVLALDTDLLRIAGVPLPYSADPSKRLRGWRTSAGEIERVRAEFEAKTGKPVFMIANTYGVAADLAFYLKDKRAEGPGHPPIYFPESPAIENQFSFWPRYDEFISVPRDQLPDSYYTEEQGINPFHGRTALYVTDRAEERVPSTLKSGFERTEMIACIDQSRRGLPLRQWRVFACYNYRSASL